MNKYGCPVSQRTDFKDMEIGEVGFVNAGFFDSRGFFSNTELIVMYKGVPMLLPLTDAWVLNCPDRDRILLIRKTGCKFGYVALGKWVCPVGYVHSVGMPPPFVPDWEKDIKEFVGELEYRVPDEKPLKFCEVVLALIFILLFVGVISAILYGMMK